MRDIYVKITTKKKISNLIIHYSKKSDHSNLTNKVIPMCRYASQAIQKPLVESLFCVLINRIKKSESPVKLREKILNFTVKLWKNYKFCRVLAQFRGKTSCMSWRHNSFSQVFPAKVEMLAISWRQNNGKMA